MLIPNIHTCVVRFPMLYSNRRLVTHDYTRSIRFSTSHFTIERLGEPDGIRGKRSMEENRFEVPGRGGTVSGVGG